MDGGLRGFLVLCVCYLVVGLLPLGIERFQKNTCRIEAIKAGVEADKINMACGD